MINTHSSAQIPKITRWFLHALVFLMPLFFLPFSLDPLEINKQTFLLIFSLLALLCWFGWIVFRRHFTLRGGWMNVLPLLLLVATILSAVFSKAPYLSWIGSSRQEYASVLSMIGFVVLTYLVSQLLAGEQAARTTRLLLLISMFLTGILGTLSLAGLPVFWFAPGGSFTTVGTVGAFGIFLAAAAVFSASLWQTRLRKGEKVLSILNIVLAFVALLIIQYWAVWILLGFGMIILAAVILVRADAAAYLHAFSIAAVAAVLAVLFVFWIPWRMSVRAPIEVSPSFARDFDIAQQTLADTSLWFGSGNGTYAFDYDKYHSPEVNKTQLWATRFENGSSFASSLVMTTGVVGGVAWMIFLITLLVASLSRMAKDQHDHKSALSVPVLFPAWGMLAAALFLYSSNSTLLFLFFLLSAYLLSYNLRAGHEHVVRKHASASGVLFMALLVVAGLASAGVVFGSSQRYLAEAAFAHAVRLDRQQGDIVEVSRLLDRAAKWNRYQDAYLRNLSMAMLLRVAQEMKAMQGAEVKQEKSELVKALVAAAVNSAVRATDLSPNNAQNWLQRGATYRELIPIVENAGEFAQAAFERAVVLQPNNPGPLVELGNTQLAIAEAARPLLSATDAKVKADAQQKFDKALADAIALYARAIALKQDYAQAHYQMAIAYDRQGKLNEAVGKMESVAKYNPRDVGVIFQLGMLYVRRNGVGDLTRALQAFEYAVMLAPAYSNARWFLASVYEQQGNVDGAILQVQKVAELNPEDENVKARLTRLQEGKAAQVLPEPVAEDATPNP